MNIKYKKGILNHVAGCFSQPPVMALIVVFISYGHETFRWPQLYKSGPDFVATYQLLGAGKEVLNFHLQDVVLCYLGHLHVPSSEHGKIIWEEHYKWVVGNINM